MRKYERKQVIAAYIFILPAILGLLLFTGLPMAYSLYLSFTDWNVLSTAQWVGWDNYIKIFTNDMFFYNSLKVTSFFTIGNVVLATVCSFGIALLLNMKIRGRPMFRAIFYMPSVVPAIATSMIWIWMFDFDFGLINHMLGWVGIPKQLWINGPDTALFSLIIVSVWASGNTIVIFLAGLQDVPRYQLESVEIDGGNYWHKLTAIIIPMMTPIIFFNVIMGLIHSFTTFTYAFAMTEGGPANSTLFYVYLIYREAFERQHMGYASALAWILFIIISVITILFFHSSRKWVYYEGGKA